MYLDFTDPNALLSAVTAIAMYDAAPGVTLAPVGFAVEATGRAQLMRTGSGFWRSDHGAPFAIDKKLLATIVRNTQIRERTLRGDYMHWSNQDRENPEDYRPAGYINPQQLTIEAWRSPENTREWGLFAPVIWTPEAKGLLDQGVNQISPVIDWNHRLRWSTPEYPAGTLLGPTITKWALVDEGFFWMDPARYYSQNQGAEELLYSEVFMLTIDELLALIQSLRDAGTPDDKILLLLKATLNGADDAGTPPAPGADGSVSPGMSATTIPEGQGAAPITMASRLYQMLAGAQPSPAQPRPAQPARAPQATPKESPLMSALMGAITSQPRPAANGSTPAPRMPQASPKPIAAQPAAFSLTDLQSTVTTAIQTALKPIVDRVDNLDINARVAQFSAAEANGLHAGLDQETAVHLFVNSPSAYQSFIAKRQALVGSTPGANPAGASPMTRAFNNSEPVDSRQALANTALAYQNDPKNVINGKKPSYDAALAYAIGVQTNQRRARGEQI